MQSEASIIKNVYNIVDSIKPEAMELTDGSGNPTTDREEARAITFPYFNYGKISVSIMNPNNLLVLVSPNMEDKMSPESKDRYKNFIMKIKKVGDSFPDVKFTINKVTGDDFHKAVTSNKTSDLQSSKEKELSMNNISEAMNPMFGSSRSSYQQLDNIKMIVKHARPVDESVKGSRTRAIKAIYLENSQGERFKLPINNLWAGRAMARHMVNNGTMYDVTGQRILEWAGRIGKLQKFARYAKNNGLVNEGTNDIMDAVSQNISDAKNILQQLSTQTGYASFNGDIPVAPMMKAEDERVARLKETFTVKTFDESLEDTLPLIGALIMEKEKDQSGDIFAGLPEVMNALKEIIMSKKLDPKVLTAIKANISDPNSASELGKKASDVSKAYTGKNDSVSNFMSRMSDILDDYHNRMAFDKEKNDPRFNKALALVQAFANANDLGALSFDEAVEIKPKNPMESFNKWANLVVEGVSVSPTNPDQQKKLNELLATPVELGEDGVNSIGSLIGIIEDDKLDGMLSELAEKDSNADARPVIIDWLKAHNLTSILEDETKEALAKDGMEINEGFTGAALGGIAGAALGKSPKAAMTGAQLGSMAQDELEKIMPNKQQATESDHMKYDTSHGGPYDRGGADAYYGRKPEPHKFVPIEGSDGHKRVALTDPEEVKAYHAGYDKHVETYGPGGEKDYREDINEAKKAKKKMSEREMTAGEKKKREKIVKGMKKGKAGFEKRYPGRGEEVMYATATKQAMKEAEETQMAKTMDAEVVKILTQIYNVIKEAAPSMPQEIAGHLFNANKEMIAAINAAKAPGSANIGEGKKSKKKVNEAPVGVGRRLGTWARGKAAGALGPLGRSWQSQIAGEKETNATANKFGLEFRKALGRANININSPEAIDALYNWASQQGLPVTDPDIEKEFKAAKTGTTAGISGSGVPNAGGTAGTPQATAGLKTQATGNLGGSWNVGLNQPSVAPAAPSPAPAASQPAAQTPVTYPKLGAAGPRPTAAPGRSSIAPMAKKNNTPLKPAIRRVEPGRSSIAPASKSAGPLNPIRKRVAPSAMKESALAEDKKTIDQLIYKLVVKQARGAGPSIPSAATMTSSPAAIPTSTVDPKQIAQQIENMSGKDIATLAKELKAKNVRIS